jgi:arylsulfatase A-like enzyme
VGDPNNPNFKETFQFFDQAKMDQLRERQIDTVRYLDGVLRRALRPGAEDTYVIVTADHGELFGELGYFGHGPIMHEKCFEVPYLEGKIARTPQPNRTRHNEPTDKGFTLWFTGLSGSGKSTLAHT